MSEHSVKFVIARAAPTKWRAECKCKQHWTADTYPAAGDTSRKHVHTETGTAPKPLGDTTVPRWEP